MARKSTTASAPETKASAPESTESPQYEPDVVLTGRLTADPVLRRTASGKAVANLRIAVNAPDAEPTFHSIVAWERTAEVVSQYLKKGRLIEVTGQPRDRSWTDRDGNERQSVEINAYRVQFLNGRRAPQADKELS